MRTTVVLLALAGADIDRNRMIAPELAEKERHPVVPPLLRPRSNSGARIVPFRAVAGVC